MSALPHLSREDILAEAKSMFDAGRERRLIALFGTGEVDLLNIEGVGGVPVVPVRSELDLRLKLLEYPEDDAQAVFLVPWRPELPMDLAGRFALQGRVRSVGKDVRLRRLFGVRSCAGEAQHSPLADYLLSSPPEVSLNTGELELTVSRLWETWLARVWGVDAEGGLALDSLLAWAARDGRGGQFAPQLASAPRVTEALTAHLQTTLGPAGPVVWRAWQMGNGERLLQHAVLFEALIPREAMGVWVRQQLRAEFGATETESPDRVAKQLAAAVSTAIPLWARGRGEERANLRRALYERADALVQDPEVRAALVDSTRLPSSWLQRLDSLGDALKHAVEARGAGTLEAVLKAKAKVEAHSRFEDTSSDRTGDRYEAAVRLLAWLLSDQSELEPGVAEPAHADVERLGRWYAEQGGFVDWARRVARGRAKTPFDLGVQAVVRAADEERVRLDRRFAAALSPWVAARRPASQVVPIEQVSRRVLAPFMAGHAERKLLVLLLDGMAWGQAVQILDSLETQDEGWGPVGWHAEGRKHKLGSARTPVVLAALPTVTEISRAAFFAGKLMAPGKAHTTDQDPERWRDNGPVAGLFEGAEYPRLFLRGEGHEAHGVASQAALTAISQRDQPVVAVVINAIDASLKGDTQHWHSWEVDSVRSLPELLAAAKEHGRSVLLASDHGHVPADCFDQSAGAMRGGGARWRPLEREADAVEEYEVKLRGEGVWAPKGHEAVALLADDRRRYGGGAHAGEHGGATLAEVVAPCVIIHWDDPLATQTDPGRTAQALKRPDWWHFEVREAVPGERPESTPHPKPSRKKSRAADHPNQLLLVPELEPESAPSAPVPSGAGSPAREPSIPPSAVAKGLGALPSIKALDAVARKEVVAAVEYLLAREGKVAQLSALASELGLPTFRVRGFVAQRLQKALNLDGFQVITYDASQVRLDAAVLEQQFGVKP